MPCGVIIHKVGRDAFRAGVHPLPMYVAAGLLPFAWGALAAVIIHHVIGVVGLLRWAFTDAASHPPARRPLPA